MTTCWKRLIFRECGNAGSGGEVLCGLSSLLYMKISQLDIQGGSRFLCLELRKKSAQRYIFIGTSILLVVEAMDIDEKPEGKGEKMKTRRSTIQF